MTLERVLFGARGGQPIARTIDASAQFTQPIPRLPELDRPAADLSIESEPVIRPTKFTTCGRRPGDRSPGVPGAEATGDRSSLGHIHGALAPSQSLLFTRQPDHAPDPGQ